MVKQATQIATQWVKKCALIAGCDNKKECAQIIDDTVETPDDEMLTLLMQIPGRLSLLRNHNELLNSTGSGPPPH